MDKLTVRFNLRISIFVVDHRKQYWIMIFIKKFFLNTLFPVWFPILFSIIYDISFCLIFSFQHNVWENVTTLWLHHKKKPYSVHCCESVGIIWHPGTCFIRLFCPKGARLFLKYISIQNCLKKIGLDRKTS